MRHRHRDRFTVVGNHLAQHSDLSAAAVGLAVYIQSLPDGADVTVKRLTLRFREGEITVRRALNELVAAGYLERRRVSLGGGRFATRVIAYDRPGGRGGGAAAPPKRPESGAGAEVDADADADADAGAERVADADAAPEPRSVPEPEDVPDAVPEPDAEAEPTAPPLPEVTSPAAPSPPAVDLLTRLRTVDARLLLSWRDVQELAPGVEKWLGRGVGDEQVVRTLTAALPPGHVPIHHPARFLAYRLDAMLPPPLPVAAPRPAAPPPLITCDGCDRAIRSHDPDALCADCSRERAGATAVSVAVA
ncbi:hypothetical protein AB0A05_04165 [Streptomyces sp. NPDC046374]|uniref:hypothetical protein n=1 Tax=Streptomyces sp. NPDC046374 TaxID=3154917 RepID=UPI0033E531D7